MNTQFVTKYAGRLLVFMAVLALLAIPVAAVNAQAAASASTSGFGAAFGYAQTIGTVSFTQAGTIGNGAAIAQAASPYGQAGSAAFSAGNASAFSAAFGSPFGATAFIQTTSFWGGSASASAYGNPGVFPIIVYPSYSYGYGYPHSGGYHAPHSGGYGYPVYYP